MATTTALSTLNRVLYSFDRPEFRAPVLDACRTTVREYTKVTAAIVELAAASQSARYALDGFQSPAPAMSEGNVDDTGRNNTAPIPPVAEGTGPGRKRSDGQSHLSHPSRSSSLSLETFKRRLDTLRAALPSAPDDISFLITTIKNPKAAHHTALYRHIVAAFRAVIEAPWNVSLLSNGTTIRAVTASLSLCVRMNQSPSGRNDSDAATVEVTNTLLFMYRLSEEVGHHANTDVRQTGADFQPRAVALAPADDKAPDGSGDARRRDSNAQSQSQHRSQSHPAMPTPASALPHSQQQQQQNQNDLEVHASVKKEQVRSFDTAEQHRISVLQSISSTLFHFDQIVKTRSVLSAAVAVCQTAAAYVASSSGSAALQGLRIAAIDAVPSLVQCLQIQLPPPPNDADRLTSDSEIRNLTADDLNANRVSFNASRDGRFQPSSRDGRFQPSSRDGRFQPSSRDGGSASEMTGTLDASSALHITACGCLHTFALSPLGRDAVTSNGGVEALFALLHSSDSAVVVRASAVLHCVTADLDACRALVDCGGVSFIVRLLPKVDTDGAFDVEDGHENDDVGGAEVSTDKTTDNADGTAEEYGANARDSGDEKPITEVEAAVEIDPVVAIAATGNEEGEDLSWRTRVNARDVANIWPPGDWPRDAVERIGRHACGILQNLARETSATALLEACGAAEALLPMVSAPSAELQAAAVGALLNVFPRDAPSRPALKRLLALTVSAAALKDVLADM